MKGTNRFTAAEVSELRKLIRERIKADRSRQKSIRNKMRKLHFYGSDFGIVDLQPSDFEELISSGRITISDDRGSSKPVPDQVCNSSPEMPDQPAAEMGSFILFDPEKHTSEHIPDQPGNYIVCLKSGASLPEIGQPFEMAEYQGYDVIYTGIAGKSLRRRDYRQHFTGNNAGSSTLRKSLGSMFGYSKIARDKDPNTGKTKFKPEDEIALSHWMKGNLILFFKSTPDPHTHEGTLINELNPPLNLSKNYNSVNRDFRKKLSELRAKK
jgi:hypothetical protein